MEFSSEAIWAWDSFCGKICNCQLNFLLQVCSDLLFLLELVLLLYIFLRFCPFHLNYLIWWYTTLCLVAQSCLTLCNPMNCSPPGSSVNGGFSKQEHWSGLPCPLPGYLAKQGIEPRSPALRANSLPSRPRGKPKNTRVGGLSLLQGELPAPGIQLGSPALPANSFL